MTLEIYNQFLFPWRVPSLNELNFARGIGGKTEWLLSPTKKKRNSYQFNGYNAIKQEWSKKCVKHIKSVGFNYVDSAFFHYLLVEPNVKRDPSNFCSSATKFIEDSLKEAKVIPNDGWQNVLGIRPYWVLDRESEGAVFLLMSNEPLSQNAIESYYNEFKNV
jgi:hypothetical protein